MADYTKINIDEQPDLAPGQGFDEIQEARFLNPALETEQTGCAHHRIKPGKRQGFGHRHDEAEEVYLVLGGSGRVNLDGEIVELSKLDAIRVGAPTSRAFEAGDEGLELLAFGARHDGDGEVLPGWWEA